jgi:hypothetical protein
MKITGRIDIDNLVMKSGSVVWQTAAGSIGMFDTEGAGAGVPVPVTFAATAPSLVTYSLNSGSLPNNLHLNANGVITGNAVSVGVFNFTVRASAGSLYADRSFSVEIINTAGGDLGN